MIKRLFILILAAFMLATIPSAAICETASVIESAEADVILSDDASDFVLLSDAVPDAILEIRYYSTYNFVGERIDGYEQPVALLTREAAQALQAASRELLEMGYRLKIFDAYRPQMAVTHFMNWALDTDDIRMKDYFYPELEKDTLFPQGYIAEHSGHSRGSTVDLTLFDMATEKEVDMGGTFDYFGELSHPDYTGITNEQYANRMILREVMVKHGFKPLAEEWWHFTLENEPFPDTYFTFPVTIDSLPEDARTSVTGYPISANCTEQFGKLLYDLAIACQTPSELDDARIEADVESIRGVSASDGRIAEQIARRWRKTYLDEDFVCPQYTGNDTAVSFDGLGIPDDDTHAIVVLGYALEDGEMTGELRGRCKAAAVLAQAFPNALIVCSGGATGENNPDRHTEAGLMKDYLVSQCGIADTRILTDERALTTAENAVNTLDMLKSNGIQSMSIVTSDYHQKRGQVLYDAVNTLYEETYGYSVELVGSFSYPVPSSPDAGKSDAHIAVRQLCEILGLPSDAVPELPGKDGHHKSGKGNSKNEWHLSATAELSPDCLAAFDRAVSDIDDAAYSPVALLGEKDGTFCVLCRISHAQPESDDSFALVYFSLEKGLENTWEIWISAHE